MKLLRARDPGNGQSCALDVQISTRANSTLSLEKRCPPVIMRKVVEAIIRRARCAHAFA
jgi:hypothetical protein